LPHWLREDAIMTDTMNFEDRQTGLVEPDTMLPTQFFGALRRKIHMDGEHRLMVAILEDAVNCFQKQLFATDPKARQLFLDAEEWITATDQSWFFSFAHVCETLDLDPDYVREGLLKWKEAQLRQRGTAVASEAGTHDDGRGAHEDDQPSLRKASGA
jgi:hypothetical protein